MGPFFNPLRVRRQFSGTYLLAEQDRAPLQWHLLIGCAGQGATAKAPHCRAFFLLKLEPMVFTAKIGWFGLEGGIFWA